jgi:hypothetical protein
MICLSLLMEALIDGPDIACYRTAAVPCAHSSEPLPSRRHGSECDQRRSPSIKASTHHGLAPLHSGCSLGPTLTEKKELELADWRCLVAGLACVLCRDRSEYHSGRKVMWISEFVVEFPGENLRKMMVCGISIRLDTTRSYFVSHHTKLFLIRQSCSIPP